MKAGGKQDGDFRELSGSLASAFRRTSYVVSFLLFYTHLLLDLAGLHGPGALMRNMIFFVYRRYPQFASAIPHQRSQSQMYFLNTQPSRSNRDGFAVIFLH